MTPERRFEEELPHLLDGLYMGPMPKYRDRVLQQTARTRQRPAWSFPGRWLPMVDIARQPILARRLPWRVIGLGLVLLALLVGLIAALAVGGQRRLPAPFGRASNGLVAYASGGDIYTVDPLTGAATAVVTGPDTDVGPVWSRDGTHFAFARQVSGPSGSARLFVATAEGRDIVTVTPDPRVGLGAYSFSPDGRDIAFTSGADGAKELWIAKADGSGGLRRLAASLANLVSPSYLPPAGREIMFAGGASTATGSGIYAVDVGTGTVRTIVAPSPGVGLDVVRVAPDGSRVSFSSGTDNPGRNTYSVHVIAADGSGSPNLVLPMPAGAYFQDAATWSNDGTRLVIVRGYAAHNEAMTLAIVPADGSASGVETKRGLTGCCDTTLEWAPDDASILVTPEDLDSKLLPQVLIDPLTGASKPALWSATSDPAWQRRAP